MHYERAEIFVKRQIELIQSHEWLKPHGVDSTPKMCAAVGPIIPQAPETVRAVNAFGELIESGLDPGKAAIAATRNVPQQ